MRKMDFRVIMVIDRYAPLWGGTENQLRQIVTHLKARGCQVCIVTRRWDKRLSRKEIIDDVVLHRVGWPGKSLLSTGSYIAALFWKLYLQKNSFDIIHTNGAAALGVLGSILSLLFKKPNVARISSAGRIPELAQKTLGRIAMQLLRKANAIISLSEDIRHELLAVSVPQARIYDINNGVDFNRFKKFEDKTRQAWRLQRGLPENAIVVIYSSLFKPGKGHVILLKAWRSIEKQVQNAWLLLVGSDNYQLSSTAKIIKATAERENLKRVIFEGETTTPETYTGIADICAFAARDESEGCPNALIEAMAAQLAPVAFDASGVRDIIKHKQNGLLVYEKSAKAFARQLMALLCSKDQRRQIGWNARQYVLEHHNFSRAADQYIDMYNRIV